MKTKEFLKLKMKYFSHLAKDKLGKADKERRILLAETARRAAEGPKIKATHNYR